MTDAIKTPAARRIAPGHYKTTAADGHEFEPPKAAQRIAASALKRRAKLPKSRRGGTGVGLARARSIAAGEPQPVKRIKAFFDRFSGTYADAVLLGHPWERSKVQQAWDLWGGDPMYRAVSGEKVP